MRRIGEKVTQLLGTVKVHRVRVNERLHNHTNSHMKRDEFELDAI